MKIVVIGPYFPTMELLLLWSYSGPYFLAFGLNTERYSVSSKVLLSRKILWSGNYKE